MTIQTIIEDAYRESNILPLGQSLETNELSDGLSRLQRLVDSWYGQVAGEYVYDWFIPKLDRAPDYALNPRDVYGLNRTQPQYPGINARLVLNLTSDFTVYFPKYPNDGSRMTFVNVGDDTKTFTINPNQKNIEGSNASIAINLQQVSSGDYFFRSDTQNWQKIEPLTLAGESPFPAQFDDLMTSALARRLSVSNGQNPSPIIEEVYRRQMDAFRARYKQLTPTNITDNIGTIQSFMVDGEYGSPDGFF